MASTNKTTHYELSQYIGSDKPTYLGDYNGDMSKIDAQMYLNATNAQLGITNAGTAQSTAETAETLATQAKGTAESASSVANTANTLATQNATNIGTMSNLNTTNKSSLVSAINEVNTTASAVDTLTQAIQDINDHLFYKAGDTLTESFDISGWVTTASTELWTAIVLPKNMDNISTVTCTGGSFVMRTTSGGYLDNNSTGIAYNASGITLTVEKRDNRTIAFVLKKSSAFTNVVNNTPVAGVLVNLTLTFS